MLSKNTFLRVIELIQTQEKIDDQFGDALKLVCDGSVVYGTDNRFEVAAMLLLKETCHDLYEYIDWWLHEDVDHTVTDDEHEWHLDTAEDLYNFLVDNQADWIAAEEEDVY